MGRPTDMTEEVQRAILASIEAGNYIETACLAAGTGWRNYYNWQKWAKEGKEPYATFFQSCARARAKHEESLVATAQMGDEKGVSHGPAKAAAWMLERTRPGKFAASLKLNLQKELDSILGLAEKVLEPDQYAKLVEAICASQCCAEETGEDPG